MTGVFTLQRLTRAASSACSPNATGLGTVLKRRGRLPQRHMASA